MTPLPSRYVCSCVINIGSEKIDAIHIKSEVIRIQFNCNIEFIPDVSETFAFQITAFPPSKPKYERLKRYFNRDDLSFYEDEREVGLYHLEYHSEGMLSPIEARIILSPNLWEPQIKRCKLTISYECLGYKYNQRKEVVDFANAISSRISWEHRIVWITEDGNKIIWKNKQK